MARKPKGKTKKVHHDLYQVQKMPEGEHFVQIWLGLLENRAWREQSINCRRLIEFLMAEHIRHGGFENGKLIATYDQLVAWGIGRRHIRPAIEEAERLGLLEVKRGGKKPYTLSPANRYRLTFLPSQETNERGQQYFGCPTFMPSSQKPEDGAGSAPKNSFQVHESEPDRFTKVNCFGARR